MNKFSEKDWKIFRSKIAGWQEAYMDKLNKEYIKILSGDGKPSEKFWTLEKRIKEDKKDCGVQCEMSRSNQFYLSSFIASTYPCKPSALRASSAYSRGETLVPIS